MANVIPGINTRVAPGVFVRQRVRQGATNVNGGLRVALLLGEGETEETLVASARGGGLDGVNSDYDGSDTPTGRHFQISVLDLVANRSSVVKNGTPLNVLEQPIDSDAFDSRYDCRLDPLTGRVELQRSYLNNFGSSGGTAVYYKAHSNNVGNGFPTITTAALVDTDAPAETWTVRCVAIVVDGSGNPIPGLARFTVTGSVSGAVKDSNGSIINWTSDGTVQSNEILSFSIGEGSAAFRVGDKFTVEVRSGVLSSGDELVAKYIPESYLNDPELFLSPSDLFAKHGQPSATNLLSLGAQMAFENGAPAVVALQCKPPVPRRTSETLLEADDPLSAAVEGATGNTDLADCIFAMAPGNKPDADLNINVFVVDDNGDETQLVLNKVEFYDTGSWTTVTQLNSLFVNGAYSSSYTVVEADEVEQEADDGYIYVDTTDGYTYFTSDSVVFSSDRVGAGESDLDNRELHVYDELGNIDIYTIDDIGDGYGDMTLARVSAPITPTVTIGTGLRWQLVDTADTSVYFALTDDVVNTYLTAGKGLRISFIDEDDSDFYDTNWGEALEAAELADAQYVVPLPTQTISNVFAACKVHVETMSNIINAKERVLIVGAINGLTAANLLGDDDAAVEDIGILEGIQGDDAEEVLASNIEDLADYSVASAYGSTYRTIYMAPDQIVRNIAGTNTTLSGYFMAPAMAGFLTGQTFVAEPPTNKTLVGFTIPRTRVYRPLTLNRLLDDGICVLQPVTGGGRIIHGLTTAQSDSPEDEEISIVGIRDQVVRAMRNAMRPFVGSLNTPTTIVAISSSADKLLRAFVSLGLLNGYSNLTVSRNPVEPRQVDIAVTVNPVGPINWIYVDIEFSLAG